MPTSSAESASRPASVLVIDDVAAGYGGVPVVRGISIEVGAGEVVAIVGPNGAGKSTLLKAVTGEIPLLGGRVSLAGTDLGKFRADGRTRRGLGYVPQARDVFDALTVADNLKIGGYLLGKHALSTKMSQAMEIFPALADMQSRIAGRLSGGERKMLAIARTLMLDPSMLILDEPSANLSPQMARTVLTDHVRRLADSGIGILLVEQKVFEALAISDWAHVLLAGQEKMAGRPAGLLEQPDLRDVFLGADTGAASSAAPADQPAQDA